MWLTWSLLQGPIIASVDIELRIDRKWFDLRSFLWRDINFCGTLPYVDDNYFDENSVPRSFLFQTITSRAATQCFFGLLKHRFLLLNY